MNLLVTGGAGFIGGHTCHALVRAGHALTVIDDLSTGSPKNVPAGVRLVQLDVASADLPGAVGEARPEVIIHLAAQTSVSRSVTNPLADARTNLMGTLNLLTAAERCGVRRVIFTSSAAVYGMPKSLPLKEDSATCPISPYGAGKLAAEVYIRQFSLHTGIPHTILRLANVYGPGQTAEGEAGVVAVFCDRAAHLAPAYIEGSGAQTRDFIYVGDVAEAIALSAVTQNIDGTYHVSSGRPTSIAELWHLVRTVAARELGSPAAETLLEMEALHKQPRPGDIRESVMSHDRIRSALGWSPGTNLEAGLALTLRAALAQGVL